MSTTDKHAIDRELLQLAESAFNDTPCFKFRFPISGYSNSYELAAAIGKRLRAEYTPDLQDRLIGAVLILLQVTEGENRDPAFDEIHQLLQDVGTTPLSGPSRIVRKDPSDEPTPELKDACQQVIDWFDDQFAEHRADARDGLDAQSDAGDMFNLLTDALEASEKEGV